MLGFTMPVGTDPIQVPNPPNTPAYRTGVGIENLDTVLTMDLCDDDSFPSPFIYTLEPGNWYSYSGSGTFWARLTPGQSGNSSALAWINPGGAANVGGNKNPNSGGLSVDIVAPNPLPTTIVTSSVLNVGPSVNPGAGVDWTYNLPQAGRIRILQASLQLSNAIKTRYPYFQIYIGGIAYRFLMSDMTAHRQSLWNFVGATGLGNPYSRYGDTVMNFSLPDIFLPAGSQVGSYTGSMDSGDYWYNIVMSMEGS
jgi:hypothetical protein